MSGLFTGDQANGYGTITSSDGLSMNIIKPSSKIWNMVNGIIKWFSLM